MTDHDGNNDWQGLQLDFIPINQPHSPVGSKPRRAYLSCERCRKRKTRCEPAEGQRQPCKRCSTDNQHCEFRASRSTKRKLSLPAEDAEPVSHGTDIDISTSTPPAARDVPVLPINSDTSVTDRSQVSRTTATLDARARLISTHIHNASDALDLLTFAASGNQAYNSPSATPSHQSQVSSVATSTAISNPPLNVDRAWKSFSLIRKGIVSQQEVMDYLAFFFDQLWPLKPVVPPYYRDRSTYCQLVAEEPLLVVCLVTLSSRYFPLPGSHGEIRSERIHWQTWRILQRSLQSVMWGTTATRSLGAISAMLLLIDWHVKAINNPTDFSEGEDETDGYVDGHTRGFKVSSENTDSLTGQRSITSISE
ncbi:zinc finger transcriptional activator [Fusarium irregulare]|uniref:Zinc finger transcriptional activator n=1 Tax=Fusarium irregulare TaxID=2494466 RepID=A0A9W8PLY6_9HYPO|nr:zinc finger transcriptional activator [Fusarium irregulare]KAJ4014632.1 zinc finger transcriptional activator [Fusarium irregulare]